MPKSDCDMCKGETEENQVPHENTKIQPTLLDSTFIEGMARVRTEGTARYGNDPDSWRLQSSQDHLDAAWRHLLALSRGELKAPEGTAHAYHVAVRLMFVAEKNREPLATDRQVQEVNEKLDREWEARHASACLDCGYSCVPGKGGLHLKAGECSGGSYCETCARVAYGVEDPPDSNLARSK